MKKNKENALRWFSQAKHDLASAKNNLKLVDFYSDACFMAEQASQKALKAYLIFKGRRFIFEHSVRELVNICTRYDKEFKKLIDAGRILDQYYIPTRYPDALAHPAVPYKSYTQKEAKQALSFAKEIIRLVDKKVS